MKPVCQVAAEHLADRALVPTEFHKGRLSRFETKHLLWLAAERRKKVRIFVLPNMIVTRIQPM
jgi:hypothetical protein